MTDSQRKRDPRYTRTVGEKPDLGRRYVENGKVKIEWYEDDKRRSRTVGDNDAETRRKADEELERLLGLSDAEPEAEAAAEDADECCECDEEFVVPDLSWLIDEVRGHADALMDLADDLAESFEKGMVRVLDAFRRSDNAGEEVDEEEQEPDVVDAEVVEEIKDPDEPPNE